MVSDYLRKDKEYEQDAKISEGLRVGQHEVVNVNI